jgi:hypothetical protein
MGHSAFLIVSGRRPVRVMASFGFSWFIWVEGGRSVRRGRGVALGTAKG